MATTRYHAFLAYSSQDKAKVEVIYRRLRRRHILVWFDDYQIPPGHWFQEHLQWAINHAKTAVIFVGERGLGRWEIVELRTMLSRCVNRGVPVIPVLLPGVKAVPAELPF